MAAPATSDTFAVPPLPDAEGPAPTNASPRCIKQLASAAPVIPPRASDKACPVDPDPHTLTTRPISFPDASPPFAISAEIADTPAEIERGLMYRKTMSDSAGMFFALRERRDHTFWMHNTCIALDMLFIADDGVIVGIVEGAAPLTDSIRNVGCVSSYVLEVNGGWSRQHNVTPGQRITIPI